MTRSSFSMKIVPYRLLPVIALFCLLAGACTPQASPSPTVAVAPASPTAVAAQPTATAVQATPTAAGQATPAATPQATATRPAPVTPSVAIVPSVTATASASVTPAVEAIATKLDTPWAIDFAPDGRIFFTERSGQVRVIKDGKLQSESWAKIAVVETGESGLMGLALDPNFTQNHYVYLAYTYRNDGGRLINRLVRYRDDPETDKGTEVNILLDGVAGASVHDGGRVKFGPDGKLYWSTGDASNPQTAQDRESLSGKILRLNPDGSIPNDNPFPNSPVYSYGHRNPQGLAWQPGTGRFYETEHGPSGGGSDCCRDEVNLIEPGKNYGWPVITGSRTQEGMVPPIIHSGDNNTWAPGGATFVTRGPWQGSLLFTGLRGQALYRVTLDPTDPRKVANLQSYFVQQYGRLRDVAEGPDGAIYLLTSNRDGRGNPTTDDDRILRLTFR